MSYSLIYCLYLSNHSGQHKSHPTLCPAEYSVLKYITDEECVANFVKSNGGVNKA